jgi:signal transduction histidine kinase/ActR/RegA family two-component response regulator
MPGNETKTKPHQGSLEVERLREELSKTEHARDRLQLLANATSVLISDSLDYEERLRNLARIIVPYFADWCAINITSGAHPSYTVVTNASPEKRKIAEEIQKRYVPKRDFNYGVAEVIRTRQATLYPTMPDELVRRTTQNEDHYRLLRELGLVSVMVVPLISRDECIGAITFVTAESGYHYNDADLEVAKQLARRAAVALDNAMLFQEVVEASRAKEKFLAMLAHELRNPLTPIRNSLPILALKGDEDYEVKDIVQIMERQISTMSRLLDDLFDVARITEGKIQFKMEEINLLSVLEHAITTLRPEFERKGFKFSAYLAEGPLHIRADKVRIEQVIVNLLNNAAKYTPPGGHISFECSREGNEAVIRVRDTGKGIPPSMLKKIFQLFIQVDQSIDRPEGGLGLGLTLVKMLVERHGGSVVAQSEGEGKGSEFVVRLPLLTETRAAEGGTVKSKFTKDVPKKILIVDDNEDAANSIGKLLRKLGHDIRITYDGITALEIAREFKPNAVLLDLGLPVMNGYETAKKMRELFADTPDILLIALSGYGQEEDRRRTTDAGFNFHLVKPFDTQELRDIMNNWKATSPPDALSPDALSPDAVSPPDA